MKSDSKSGSRDIVPKLLPARTLQIENSQRVVVTCAYSDTRISANVYKPLQKSKPPGSNHFLSTHPSLDRIRNDDGPPIESQQLQKWLLPASRRRPRLSGSEGRCKFVVLTSMGWGDCSGREAPTRIPAYSSISRRSTCENPPVVAKRTAIPSLRTAQERNLSECVSPRRPCSIDQGPNAAMEKITATKASAYTYQ